MKVETSLALTFSLEDWLFKALIHRVQRWERICLSTGHSVCFVDWLIDRLVRCLLHSFKGKWLCHFNSLVLVLEGQAIVSFFQFWLISLLDGQEGVSFFSLIDFSFWRKRNDCSFRFISLPDGQERAFFGSCLAWFHSLSDKRRCYFSEEIDFTPWRTETLSLFGRLILLRDWKEMMPFSSSDWFRCRTDSRWYHFGDRLMSLAKEKQRHQFSVFIDFFPCRTRDGIIFQNWLISLDNGRMLVSFVINDRFCRLKDKWSFCISVICAFHFLKDEWSYRILYLSLRLSLPEEQVTVCFCNICSSPAVGSYCEWTIDR